MAQPFTLGMVEGGGVLTIRGFDPFSLANPTSITGTVDTGDGGTGAITGAGFATPTVSFETEITSPIAATVFVDAAFSPVGSGIGAVDHEGNVVVQTALEVDLHIEVVGLTADCTASPVNVTLTSTEPYDPETQQVTVADANITVPAAPTGAGGTCPPLIGDEVNNLLAGPGHALALTLQGAIDLPPAPGCETVTDLAVTPAGGTRLGQQVTLDASVALAPAAEDDPVCAELLAEGPENPVPGGFVDIRDGDTVIASLPLAAGAATLATSDLPAGNRDLSARYRGEPPFRASTSDATPHLVAATPALVTSFPEFVPTGVATAFDVELDNNGLGDALENARLDVTLTRASAAAFTPALMTLEYHDGTDWVPVALAVAAAPRPGEGRLLGSVGDPFPFRPGDNRVIPMRITPAASIIGGLIDVAFELIEVDPDTALPAPVGAPAPAAAAAVSLAATLVEATRRPTTLTFRPPPPNPLLGTPSDPVMPRIARRGYQVVMPDLRLGASVGVVTGSFQVLFDGVPIPVRRYAPQGRSTPLADGYLPRVLLTDGASLSLSLAAIVPLTASLGTHTVQVRYSGDANFAPSITPEATITVLPALEPIFECQAPAFFPFRFTTMVRVTGGVPTYARVGTPISIAGFDVDLSYDRGGVVPGVSGGMSVGLTTTFGTGPLAVGSGNLTGIRFGFGPAGEGTATSLTRTGTPLVNATSPDPTVVDQTVSFTDEQAALTIDAPPGTVVPVALESIHLDYDSGPGAIAGAGTVLCTPLGDPIELGRVTVAGTSLAVTPNAGIRVGDRVSLAATVAPVGVAGNVVFSDNGVTVGVVPVAADGTATTTAVLSSAGPHALKARFFGGLAVLSSEAEQSVDVAAIVCGQFAVAGHGATVRLVYLELLGRCPDQVGFDHWVDRLENGLSVEAFARAIARTAEAVGRVVDDAYGAMLDRPADPAGRTFWTGQLQAHGRHDRLVADLGASNEFWTKAGATDVGFVTRVYDRLLHRAPDTAGLDYWVGRLDAGTSRRALVISLANLDEPLGVLVVQSYDEILDRAPDAGERATGIAHLRSTGDRSGLYAQLIGRPEFATRAQGFPNPGG